MFGHKEREPRSLDFWDKSIRVFAAAISLTSFISLYIWASQISSWDFSDTAFIIQKENVGGIVYRTLPLILINSLFFTAIITYTFFIIGIFVIILKISDPNRIVKFISFLLYNIRVSYIYRKFNKMKINFAEFCNLYNSEFKNKEDRIRRYSNDRSPVYLVTLLIWLIYFIIASIILVLLGWLVFFVIIKLIFRSYDFTYTTDYDYWIFGNYETFFIAAILFSMTVLFVWHKVKYRKRKVNIILSISLVFAIIVSLSSFNYIYSRGYGTECISLEVEDGVIKDLEMNNAEGQEGKLKHSWAIQSGGKDIAEMLDKNKGNNTYVLASYVYSEDKDYLNIMVFSIREIYKDTEGNTRAKSDLLINKNGNGKSGVLVSIKKSSIAGRYLSNPLCFKGEF